MLDANTVKMALYIVGSGLNAFANSMQDYPDLLAELLETCSGLTAQCTSDSESGQWYIVRAALWSSWQRSILLYHYASMRDALEKCWTGMGHMRFRLRSTTPMPGLSIQEMLSRYSGLGKARSMCSWAFELLRTEPACIGMDFRTFHRRYLQLWSKASARCKKDSPLPCAGKDPDGCWRFKGMVIKDQSAHDDTCSKECRKLPWDKASYREASGARAVIIIPEESTAEELRLRYCTASVRTLAISHVWSHGQGGRPHEGVNSCLHRRYVNIGQHLGCDSYWWDSSCIPEDHVLRSEAIQGINQTFSSAKVILVCDKDLMRISISDLTLEIEESILATVLVCDWNLRAWTFPESIRGRHQIHLLCKDNKIISFRKVVQNIFRYGSLDLVIFGLTVSHMLPGSIQIRSLKGAGPLVYAGIKLDNRDTPPEYLIREEGGEILSYRPASRTGDDIVIWSLLVNEDKCDSPEEFWRSELGEFIHTGFLMSSAPRLNIKSLSWAPSTPYFKPLADNPAAQLLSFRAFSGRETLPGKIIEKGLLADWLVYEFESRSIITHGDQHAIQSRQMVVLRTIHNLYLPQSKWGVLLLPLSNVRTFERGGDISTKYRGLVRGTLVAVLASDSVLKPSQQAAEERGWRWKGTFEWNDGIELPAFTEQSEFLIE